MVDIQMVEVDGVKRAVYLDEGQFWSAEFIGYIDCGNGKLRKPAVWGDGKPTNTYYIVVNCSFCEKRGLKDDSNSKRSKHTFCSKECKKSFLERKSRGNRSIKPRENGGHHVMVKIHDHPRASPNGFVYEHILVAEETLGRSLMPDERVHHINCVKHDNRPDNLFVCSGNSEHNLIHGSLNKCVAELLERGYLKFNRDTKTYEVKGDK